MMPIFSGTWIMVVSNHFKLSGRLKQEVQFYSSHWMSAHVIAFGKRWYDSHLLPI